MNVLVTGGAGYIGSFITHLLTERGYKPIVFDNLSLGHREAVDIRSGSPTFGRWTGTLLSDKNRRQLFIPEGFAHGFCGLSEIADVIYRCTDLYTAGDEYGILWSDPTIDIVWPIENPGLSEKDAKNPLLQDVSEGHLPLYDAPDHE